MSSQVLSRNDMATMPRVRHCWSLKMQDPSSSPVSPKALKDQACESFLRNIYIVRLYLYTISRLVTILYYKLETNFQRISVTT